MPVTDPLQTILAQHRHRITDSVSKARARGLTQPVVFLCELADAHANVLARSVCGDDQVDRLEESAVAGIVPGVAFFSRSLTDALDLLEPVWPLEAIEVLEATPPGGGCRFVVLGAGGGYLVAEG